MPSSNPALNDAIFSRETQAAHGGSFEPAFDSPANELPPDLFTPGGPGSLPPTTTRPGGPILGDTATGDTMRLGGTLSATAILLGFLLVAAWFGWHSVTVVTAKDAAGHTQVLSSHIPAWLIASLFVGMGLAFLTIFKPKLARITAPLYAAAEGLLLGGISHLFNAQYNGIVLSAVSCTIGVFVMMLILYATRTIRVTNRLRTGIIAATGAVFLIYMVDLVMSMFGVHVPMIQDSGPMGILFSLVVVGIASFNLLLDFDFIERGVTMRAPRYMEWYAAFGLILTLVWLYLEILRLLAKLRSR